MMSPRVTSLLCPLNDQRVNATASQTAGDCQSGPPAADHDHFLVGAHGRSALVTTKATEFPHSAFALVMRGATNSHAAISWLISSNKSSTDLLDDRSMANSWVG